MESRELEQAYVHCQQITANHYENFPVASHLLPKRLRAPVSVIYAFARQADDLADEGDLSPEQRLQALDKMAQSLDDIARNRTQTEPLYLALAHVIREHRLPLQPFYDLLAAFHMDVEKTRYQSFDEIMHYCTLSANPIGLLLLHLYQRTDSKNIQYSNAMCSALQLINFYQDLAQDYHENNRIYLPEDEMQRFGVTERYLQQQITDESMHDLMQLQYGRARKLLQQGMPLGSCLPGRIGMELRMIIAGGSRILDKLEGQGDLFSRPRLNGFDWTRIMLRALRADKGSRI